MLSSLSQIQYQMIIPNKDKLKFCDNRPKNIENSFLENTVPFSPRFIFERNLQFNSNILWLFFFSIYFL